MKIVFSSRKFLLAAGFLTSLVLNAGEKNFQFSDFGGIGDGKTDNSPALTRAVEALRTAPGATLTFEPGDYRFFSLKEKFIHERYHKIISGLKSNTLDGNGANLIFSTPEDGGFFFRQCENVTFRNFTMDYDPLPYTQGEIVSIDAGDKFTFIFRPEQDFPFPVSRSYQKDIPDKPLLVGYVFDQKTRLLYTGAGRNNHKNIENIEALPDGTFRIAIKSNTRPDGIEPGRLFAVVPRNWCALALAFEDCIRPTVEDISLYSSPIYGLMFRNSTAPHVNRVKIMLKPGSSRLLATCADGIFFDGGPEGPIMENCLLQGVMDDAVVLMVNNGKILRIEDEQTIFLYLFWRTAVRPGDVLEGIDAEGNRTGPLPPVESVGDVQTIAGVGTGRMVRFSQPVNLQGILKLFNVSMCNENFIVRNNMIVNVRGKGLKLHGRNGLAENNSILNCTFGGIEIGYQAFSNNTDFIWAENLTVRNNRVEGASVYGLQEPRTLIGWEPGIRIHQGPDHFKGRPNRNIRVENNFIGHTAQSAIRAWAVDGLTISGNRIGYFNQRNLPSENVAIDLINIHNGIVENNSLLEPRSGMEILRIAPTCENIQAENNLSAEF